MLTNISKKKIRDKYRRQKKTVLDLPTMWYFKQYFNITTKNYTQTGRRYAEECGMKISVLKTKVMRINNNNEKITIMINEGKVQQIEKFIYLGNILNNDWWRCNKQIKTRTVITKEAFNGQKRQFVVT